MSGLLNWSLVKCLQDAAIKELGQMNLRWIILSAFSVLMVAAGSTVWLHHHLGISVFLTHPKQGSRSSLAYVGDLDNNTIGTILNYNQSADGLDTRVKTNFPNSSPDAADLRGLSSSAEPALSDGRNHHCGAFVPQPNPKHLTPNMFTDEPSYRRFKSYGGEEVRAFSPPHMLDRTQSFVRQHQHQRISPPPWWPKSQSYNVFPHVFSQPYNEGQWCRNNGFRTEIAVFNCVMVDPGTVHPEAVGGLMTSKFILSHDPRVSWRADKVVKEYDALAVPGMHYYPGAPGHFLHEIFPRLLILHLEVPQEIPLLWPDKPLSRRILDELRALGHFNNREIVYSGGSEYFYAKQVYAFMYADDSAYFNNFAGLVHQIQVSHSFLRGVVIGAAAAALPGNHPRRGAAAPVAFLLRPPGRRSIRNIERVKAALSFANVTYFHFEESRPFFETAAALHDARVFIAAHGAGMSNVLFLRPGAAAVEIVFHDPSFRCPEEYYCVCRVLGVEYYMVAAAGGYASELEVLDPAEIAEIVRERVKR